MFFLFVIVKIKSSACTHTHVGTVRLSPFFFFMSAGRVWDRDYVRLCVCLVARNWLAKSNTNRVDFMLILVTAYLLS